MDNKLEKVVETAKKNLGVPYYTGGIGPDKSWPGPFNGKGNWVNKYGVAGGRQGFGCAMLGSYCYWKAGLGDISGNTYDYWYGGKMMCGKQFKEVKSAAAVPGDLIIWVAGGIGMHISIYIGSGKMIEAAGEGMTGAVATNPVDSGRALGRTPHYLHFKDAGRLPTDGKAYNIISAIKEKYCIDIQGGSMENNANAQLHTINGTQAQQFIIQDVEVGYVRIINKKSGFVLDAAGGKAKNGTNIWQHEWNGTKAQLWKMRMNADRTITFESAINDGFVIDVKGGKAVNKQNLQLYKNNGTKAQRFILVNV